LTESFGKAKATVRAVNASDQPRRASKKFIREMTRLPASGSSLSSPLRDEGELKLVLSKLCSGQALRPTAIHESYVGLSALIGQWMSEQARLEASSVGKALLTTAKRLLEVCSILDGLESGIHSTQEIEVSLRIAKYLALVPGVRSPEEAGEIISKFRQEADRIAHVCMVARADLPDQPEEKGRRALGWYDDFTTLLLKLAEEAGVQPTLRKDRSTGLRSGWLLEAAQALESFLWSDMRSPSTEACGKRLERSLGRLRTAQRQKSRGG
jgi:hypothetical protein